MADEEPYLAEEIDDKLPTDVEVVDVATQTEEKHSNRRYIHCNIPNKFGQIAHRSKLPREIWIWILGLSLKSKIKNVGRDFSNGYAIAEVLHHYYPQNIIMAQYSNGDSLPTKIANWQQLERFFKRQKGRLFDKGLGENITATQHEKPGAAEILIIWLYETLTGKIVKTIPGEFSNNYTDDRYQQQLPLYARHTASSAIKRNLKLTEEFTCPNRNTQLAKTQKILERHKHCKDEEKEEFPYRYEINATLGELAQRIPQMPDQVNNECDL